MSDELLKLTYDAQSDSLDIELDSRRKRKTPLTTDVCGRYDSILIDVGQDNIIARIEIIDASKQFDPAFIEAVKNSAV